MNNDNAGWEKWKAIKELFGSNKEDIKKANVFRVKTLLAEYLKLQGVTKPSLLHSLILTQAVNLYEAHENKTAIDIIIFCKMWDFRYFREGTTQNDSDFLPYIGEYDGKKIAYPSLAMRATRAVLEEAVLGKDKQSIEHFLPFLNKIIDLKCEDIIWAKLTRAKCYKFLGDFEGAKGDMLYVLRQKAKNTWAWDYLGEIFALSDENMEFACYCKALSMVNSKMGENFVGQIRQKLANLLIKRQNLSAAKYELECVFKCYEKNGWKIPPGFMQQLKSLENVQSAENNKDLYAEFCPLVDEFAPKNKGQFAAQNKGNSKKEFTKIPQEILDKAKDFSGKIKLHEKGFGFVKCALGDIFISPTLITKHGIKDGETISGKATFNVEKNSFKALTITKA